MVFTLARALAYATIFVGFLGVFLPVKILQSAGFTAPDALHAPQIVGTNSCATRCMSAPALP